MSNVTLDQLCKDTGTCIMIERGHINSTLQRYVIYRLPTLLEIYKSSNIDDIRRRLERMIALRKESYYAGRKYNGGE